MELLQSVHKRYSLWSWCAHLGKARAARARLRDDSDGDAASKTDSGCKEWPEYRRLWHANRPHLSEAFEHLCRMR